jgi:HAD superfamily hydrolase (TIGR01509 family)
MKIKALIFDVDGTLADTEEAHRRAFNLAFEQQGLDWHWGKAEYSRLLRTTGGKERIGAYIESLALESGEHRAALGLIPAIHRCKTENYIRLIENGDVPLREGVARLLSEAEDAGLRLAIASTTTRRNIDALLDAKLGMRAGERFAVIAAGDQVPRKKPAPDIYHLVIRELAMAADDCVAIEDSAHGLAAAKGAGLFTVVTPSQWTEGEDFSAADLVLPSLENWGWRNGSPAVGEA